MSYTKSEYEKQFYKSSPNRSSKLSNQPFHTNKSVQSLIKVLSGMESIHLQPLCTKGHTMEVPALKSRMPEDFSFRIDYLTFECPDFTVASRLLKCIQTWCPEVQPYALYEPTLTSHIVYTSEGKTLSEEQRLGLSNPVFIRAGHLHAPDGVLISVPGALAGNLVTSIQGGLLDTVLLTETSAPEGLPWYNDLRLCRLDTRLAQSEMCLHDVCANYDAMVTYLPYKPKATISKEGYTLHVCMDSNVRYWKVYSYLHNDYDPEAEAKVAHNVVAEQTIKRNKLSDLEVSRKLFISKDQNLLSDLWAYFESDFTSLFGAVRDLKAFQDFFDWLDPVKEEDELWKNGLQLAMDNRNGCLSAQDGSQSVSRLVNMEAYPYFLAIVYLCFTKKPEPTKDEIHVHLNAADLLKCFGIQENTKTLSHLRNKLSLVEQMSVETKTPGGKFNYLPLVRERVLDTHNSAMIIDKTSVSLVLSKKALRIILANTTVVSGSIFSDFLAAYNTEFEKRRGSSSVGKSRSRLPVYFYPMLLSALSLQNGSVNYTGPMGNVAHMRKFLNFLFKFLNDNSYLAVPAIESKSRGVTHKLKENTFKLPWKTK